MTSSAAFNGGFNQESKFLVYTSAGDRANFEPWLAGEPKFDLFLSYYGDLPGRYSEVATYYEERKGGKFPNLLAAWRASSQIFSEYAAVMVMDDDIQISTEGINRCFEIAQKYNLWCCQPAFGRGGHISHWITEVDQRNMLRFTNFVEVTCPIFRTDVLASFLEEYDPEVVGWGVDWWFLYHMSILAGAEGSLEGKVAVIDEVSCVNPPVRQDGTREIESLEPMQVRARKWALMKRKKNIRVDETRFIEYSRIRY